MAGQDGLASALTRALGAKVTGLSPLSGGDINQAFAVKLVDGRQLFAKTNPRAPRDMFAAEARGLAWLAEARALRVPDVLAVSSPDDDGPDAPAFLALELLQARPNRPDFDETLGRGLAVLHRFGAPGFGLDHDNYIGPLPQSNRAHDTWPDFYRRERLEPQLRRAVDRGRASPRMQRAFDRLFAVLPDLCGPPEPPSRLHGDLWGGNLLTDDTGGPCLIDPAVYGGHREVDLAMMRLFGGFGPRVFAAYEETFPLSPGHEERIDLYQLYPLLVHVNLFGGSYAASVESALARLL